MPVRAVTHRIASITDFVKEYNSSLRMSALLLSAEEIGGEPASEIKVDFILPLVGRKGPVVAQLVSRNHDGSFAFRLPDIPTDVKDSFQKIFQIIREVKALLIAAGEVVLPGSERVVGVAQPPSSAPRTSAGPRTPQAGAKPALPRPGGRGIPLPDIANQKPTLQGPLGDRDLRHALLTVAFKRMTGLLTVVPKDGPRRFGFWFHGGPVAWKSDPVDETEVLGILLFRAGKITEEAIAESLKTMEKEGIRQGEALMRAGLLTFPQLVLVLQKQVEYIFQKVMRIKEGAWAFFELENLPENFVTPPLRVPSLLYRALKNYTMDIAMETIAAAHRPNLDRYVFISAEAEGTIDEVAFSGPEKKFLEIIKGNSWRLREVFSVSNLSRTETANTIWALNEMRFLEYRDEETSSRYLTRVGARIQQKVGQLRTGTHFDVLEVHWICLKPEIEASYQRLKAEFVPENFPNVTPELLVGIQRIQEGIDKAFNAVREDYTRRAYREELIEKTQIEQSAEMLSRKGDMALLKNDRREALGCFSKAHELMPKVAAYKENMDRARH